MLLATLLILALQQKRPRRLPRPTTRVPGAPTLVIGARCES